MMKKKKVAVLMGGWSAEREVSLQSGKTIIETLRKEGHEAIAVDVTRDINALLKNLSPQMDVVFNALHGTGGEDGVIQGLLEIMKIPYTHSGVRASALAFDKAVSKQLFSSAGIPTSPWKVLSVEEVWDNPQFVPPFQNGYVIKPVADGSSVGIVVIKKGDPLPPRPEIYPPSQKLLLEEYIQGREIQVAVLGDKAIGAIEICPKRGFYDYKAKYTEGFADHLMPAPLPPLAYEKVLELGLKAHHALGCRGISRSDFLYVEEKDTFYILELNTQPGMTPLSLFPEIAAHAGVPFEKLLNWMIEEARCDH